VKQLPRFSLRIGLFKVGKEFGVGEMLQAGGVVSHTIAVSREEEREVAVAVLMLVLTAVVAELGSDSIRRDRSFVHAQDGRSVVTSRAYCAIGEVGTLGDEADLGELAGLFQVTVRDGSLGVVEGHKVSLDVLGEGLLPGVRSSLVIVEDSSHAGFSCVHGAQE
jgi:hypothetical protein